MNDTIKNTEGKIEEFAAGELAEFKTVWATHPVVTVLFGAACGLAGWLLHYV